MYRTHKLNELRTSNINQEVTLSGWVNRRRDHGGLIFIDLRDRYGITQIVFDPQENINAHKIAENFRNEFVVKVTGKVRARLEGATNPNLVTGEIEVLAESVEILNKSKTPPFEINNEEKEAAEDIRLKYRYLDLRRKNILDKIIMRSKMNKLTRDFFTDNDFLEIQTPIFTVSSPEGARDFLVPSRIHPGKYYALPQAPQQYKQLLMVGGVDKYFQIAPCFRDEDPRADRHSCEFYQIDVEMSFVETKDIFEVAENYLKDLIKQLTPNKSITEDSFRKLPYKEAIDKYGSDKPDLRFDMQFIDLCEELKDSEFGVFSGAIGGGGTVKALRLESQQMTRKEIDELTEVAKKSGAKGLAYIVYEEEGLKSPILKFLSESEINSITNKTGAKTGDIVFFGAGDYKTTCTSLASVRLALRDMYKLADQDKLCFTWITDFPMFSVNDEGKLDFDHNPFSMPYDTLEEFLEKDPLQIFGMQYDLALNGYEILSGSIRNHSTEYLVKAFEKVGLSEKEVKDKFGAMYNAFQFGAPPHGGFAFGFDRLLMILMDESNIRDIYAFPKSGKAMDVMMDAPSFIDEEQLEELNIKNIDIID